MFTNIRGRRADRQRIQHHSLLPFPAPIYRIGSIPSFTAIRSFRQINTSFTASIFLFLPTPPNLRSAPLVSCPTFLLRMFILDTTWPSTHLLSLATLSSDRWLVVLDHGDLIGLQSQFTIDCSVPSSSRLFDSLILPPLVESLIDFRKISRRLTEV